MLRPMKQTFKDNQDRRWKIEFDAFLLDDVYSETGIDLADMSASGYAQIGNNIRPLVKVLVELLRHQLKAEGVSPAEFNRSVNGEVAEEAFHAIMGAAENFFQPSQWSGLRSNLKTQEEIRTAKAMAEAMGDANQLIEMMAAYGRLPKELREQVAREAGATDSDLRELEKVMSAGGQDAMPAKPATSSPAKSESQPAA